MNVTKRLPFTAENTVLVIMVSVGGDIQLGFTLLPKPNRFLPKTVVIRSLFDKYPAAFTHEMGHAVGLLADEYYYQSEDFVFDEKECQEMLDWQKEGYYLNVSASSNESEVFWSQFITDDAYSTENIGIYEFDKEINNFYKECVYGSAQVTIGNSSVLDGLNTIRKLFAQYGNNVQAPFDGQPTAFIDILIAIYKMKEKLADNLRTI